MKLISFLLLVGPGVLVWKICDDREMKSAGEIVRTILGIILDCCIIMILGFLTFTIVYGKDLVSFYSAYQGIDKSIYSVSFVCKYGFMSCFYGIILACIRIGFRKIMHRRERMRKNA